MACYCLQSAMYDYLMIKSTSKGLSYFIVMCLHLRLMVAFMVGVVTGCTAHVASQLGLRGQKCSLQNYAHLCDQ